MKRFFVVSFLLFVAFHTFAQFTVSGKITDEQGNPLAGATVNAGQNSGTVTGTTGFYQLQVKEKGKIKLTASFLGFEKQTVIVLVENDVVQHFSLKPSVTEQSEIIISAVRAKDNTPVAHSSISEKVLDKQRSGQDIPYILALLPSVVQSSDAGAGIGYTSLTIRGSDITRINVTVNDIPINDSESHGVWWVNMPDFVSSVGNIQVQRGAGSSTNGAGAFGASVHLNTESVTDASAEINSVFGSFNTFKNSVKASTGLLNNRFYFNTRLSVVHSDGFIDRAAADLKSAYISAGYKTEKSLLELNVFTGLEKTYQAWNGVPKVRLENDAAGMQRYLDHWLYSEQQYNEMLASNSRTYNLYTYENEIDHYNQTHAQLIYSSSLTRHLSIKTALHYTRGLGFYEQFKPSDKFSKYGLDNLVIGSETITKTDLVRRKWLDNHFGGITYALNFNKNNIELVWGGSANQYYGAHYGEITWAKFMSNGTKDFRWYYSDGIKTDLNTYFKANYHVNNFVNLFADLQYRNINYHFEGTHDDLRNISQEHRFNFFNPKAGVYVTLNEQNHMYISYAKANREPSRNEYRDADINYQPQNEEMQDFEAGYKMNTKHVRFEANTYFMYYNNQLVLTGKINNVGSAIRTNVDKSYRAGIELSGAVKVTEMFSVAANLTLSDNKILDFTEFVDNWDTGAQDETYLGTVDIAFSPAMISNFNLNFEPVKNLNFAWLGKYVGKQYIDNTSNNNRSIDAYFVNDLQITYSLPFKAIKSIDFNLKINNILNHEYETNAWVYSYLLGGERFAMDGYFPQAGINFLGGITVKF